MDKIDKKNLLNVLGRLVDGGYCQQRRDAHGQVWLEVDAAISINENEKDSFDHFMNRKRAKS